MERKEVKKFEPEQFCLETSSIWSFPERGDWATHDGKYRGNWSPYIPRNVILRYSKPGDLVLDQFAGGGTTLVEAKLLNRNCIGIDININALKRCVEKCSFDFENAGKIYFKQGDARNLYFIPSNSIDLICSHPPYADIIHYSNDLENDLSLLDEEQFINEMAFVANESFRVLKKNCICAILIGDIRRNGNVVPLGFRVMQEFIQAGFTLKEIVIKHQHNCKSTSVWHKKRRSFLLLEHEYLYIFVKGEV